MVSSCWILPEHDNHDKESVMDMLQLEDVEERAAQLQATVRDLEIQLEESRSAVRSKENQLEEQRRKERELLTTVTR